MFKCYCEDARSHPLIDDFIVLVEKTRGEGVLNFADLQTPLFMPYWKNLCILEFVPGKEDYRFRFWGTELVHLYEYDLTDKMMSQVYPDDRYKHLHDLHTESMKDQETICASGNLAWMDREHTKWHQVTMPLERNGKVAETVSYLLFE